jgi:hypothetical protein
MEPIGCIGVAIVGGVCFVVQLLFDCGVCFVRV